MAAASVGRWVLCQTRCLMRGDHALHCRERLLHSVGVHLRMYHALRPCSPNARDLETISSHAGKIDLVRRVLRHATNLLTLLLVSLHDSLTLKPMTLGHLAVTLSHVTLTCMTLLWERSVAGVDVLRSAMTSDRW